MVTHTPHQLLVREGDPVPLLFLVLLMKKYAIINRITLSTIILDSLVYVHELTV